jgi:AmiR/NasT family two-component response regulator
MRPAEPDHLRVLIADESEDRLARVATMVVELGHIVIARELDVSEIAAVTARERPDVALVAVGDSSDHALELIERIVREAACPVIAVLHAPDPEFAKKASRLGAFAFVSDADNDDWQSAIDTVLRRFAEYHDLHGTFGPRALIERAKGVLMERHGVDEDAAGEMLDKHARSHSRTVLEAASALAGGSSLGR